MLLQSSLEGETQEIQRQSGTETDGVSQKTKQIYKNQKKKKSNVRKSVRNRKQE